MRTSCRRSTIPRCQVVPPIPPSRGRSKRARSEPARCGHRADARQPRVPDRSANPLEPKPLRVTGASDAGLRQIRSPGANSVFLSGPIAQAGPAPRLTDEPRPAHPNSGSAVDARRGTRRSDLPIEPVAFPRNLSRRDSSAQSRRRALPRQRRTGSSGPGERPSRRDLATECFRGPRIGPPIRASLNAAPKGAKTGAETTGFRGFLRTRPVYVGRNGPGPSPPMRNPTGPPRRRFRASRVLPPTRPLNRIHPRPRAWKGRRRDGAGADPGGDSPIRRPPPSREASGSRQNHVEITTNRLKTRRRALFPARVKIYPDHRRSLCLQGFRGVFGRTTPHWSAEHPAIVSQIRNTYADFIPGAGSSVASAPLL